MEHIDNVMLHLEIILEYEQDENMLILYIRILYHNNIIVQYYTLTIFIT
jgi:hypothetical protein